MSCSRAVPDGWAGCCDSESLVYVLLLTLGQQSAAHLRTQLCVYALALELCEYDFEKFTLDYDLWYMYCIVQISRAEA